MTDGSVADLPPRPDAADVDWDTFVSYRHTDREIAHQLAQRLATRELRVFFDERGIQLGAEWEQVLGAALDVTRSCTVLVGGRGVGGVQADEVRRALERQAGDPDFPVIAARRGTSQWPSAPGRTGRRATLRPGEPGQQIHRR